MMISSLMASRTASVNDNYLWNVLLPRQGANWIRPLELVANFAEETSYIVNWKDSGQPVAM